MPKKPAPTRPRTQRRVQNEHHLAAGGALLASNAVLAAAAVELEIQDANEGKPLRGRYVRIRAALMRAKGCSKAAAERAIAEGKILFIEQFRKDLPNRREAVLIQLQSIADAHQAAKPDAAVRALDKIARILGLYAPTKVSVTHGMEAALQLDAILGILDEAGHAALQIVLAQIEAAKTDGRLALPPPTDETQVPVQDAEFTDRPEEN